MSLTTCIKKAGDFLRPEDKAAILERALALRQGGTATAEAGRQAITEQRTSVQQAIDEATKPAARALDQQPAPKPLQQTDGKPLGQIHIPTAGVAQGKSIISLLEGANYSTFVHESGHFFLEVQADLASRIQQAIDSGAEVSAGERGIVDDMNTLLEWFGIKARDGLSPIQVWNALPFEERRPAHEKFAQGFEKFAMEGKAPSLELQGTFSRFRSWLISVYRDLRNLKVNLTDEVRQVMGRMIASDFAIEDAESARAMFPMVKTLEDAQRLGWSKEQFDAYHAQAQEATDDAIAKLEARSLKDMKWLSRARSKALTDLQKQADAERQTIRTEVDAELDAMPVYKAKAQLDALQVNPDAEAARGIWEEQRKTAHDAALAQAKADLIAANPDAKGIQKGQLLAKNKRAMENQAQAKTLEWEAANPRPAKYQNATDADLQVIAESNGYASVDEMLHEVQAAGSKNDVAAAMTDQRMLERHGDLTDQASLEKAADEAVHNEARARFIAAEMQALQRASKGPKAEGRGQGNLLLKAAREFAAQQIAGLRVRDIRPEQYAAAEARNAKLAEKAFAAGKIDEAALHKRNQLVNHALAAEAQKLQRDVQSGLNFFKRALKPGRMPAEYLDRVQALLEKFDLHRATTVSELENRRSFLAWTKDQLKQGELPPNFELLLAPSARKQLAAELEARGSDGELIYTDPEAVADLAASYLDRAPLRSYKEMTGEEFRSLVDTVRQIDHVGRRMEKVLTSRDNRLFKELLEQLRASIVEHANGRTATDTRSGNTNADSLKLGLRGLFFSHIKASNEIQIIDGRPGGEMWEAIVRPANEAGDAEIAETGRFHDKLRALLDTLPNKGKLADKPIYFPTIGLSLNRNAVLSLASEMGNASNRQRLLGGNGWTMEQLKPVFDTMTASEWQFVQSLGNLYEELWPRIKAMEEKIRGVAPDRVERKAFTVQTSDGQTLHLDGWYSPVIYDPRASGAAMGHAEQKDAKAMMDAARTRATVNRSFAKARVEEIHNRPLMMSLDAKMNAITDSIHYLHWQPWIIDANRLLKGLDPQLREHYGHEVVKLLRDWATANAAGMAPVKDAAERMVTKLARNVSFVGLAFNFLSAASQVAGYTQSMVALGEGRGAFAGTGWMARGLAHTFAHPVESYKTALAKSEFMAKRTSTRIRDIAELSAQVRGQSKARQNFDRWGYGPMLAMQTAVDLPTWWAGYEQEMAASGDEERAIARADQVVRDAQGSGVRGDLSSLERQPGAIRLLTGFMSFMNVTLNMNYRTLKSEASIGKKAIDLFLINVLPVAMVMAIKALLTPGDADKDPEAAAKRFLFEQFAFMFGQMVGLREIAQIGYAFGGFPQGDYGGAVGLRMAGDILKLAKQVGQGQIDDAFRKAAINAAGDFLRLPSAAANRLITGAQALSQGKTQNPMALLTGYEEPHR